MSDLAFLIVGLVALFGVSVPLFTIASKAVLTLRRRRMNALADFGSTPNYLLIVGPVLLPVLWVLSAGLHQSEAGWFAGATGAAHLAGQACWNALMLGVVAALAAAATLLRSRRRLGAAPERQACSHPDRAERVANVCASHPVLARLRRRVLVVDRDGDQACTTGVIRPVIEVSCQLVDSLDDDALQGALLHEAEHVRGFDPLRYLMASVALSLNPTGWLLADESRRWRLAREARCDRGAVSRGASPLSLAEALLVAVRAGSAASSGQPALAHSGEGFFLRIRIQLLLGYASTCVVVPSRVRPVLVSAIAIVLLTVWLPHAFSAWPLDGLHTLVDATLAGKDQL